MSGMQSTLCDAHLVEKLTQLSSQMSQMKQMQQNYAPSLEALAAAIPPADLQKIKAATPAAPQTDISSILQTVLCSGLMGNLSPAKTDPAVICKNYTQSCMSQIQQLAKTIESAFSGSQSAGALNQFRQYVREMNQIVGSPKSFNANMGEGAGNLSVRMNADPTVILNNPIFNSFNKLRGGFGGLFGGFSGAVSSLLGSCSACDSGMANFQDQGCAACSVPETGQAKQTVESKTTCTT